MNLWMTTPTSNASIPSWRSPLSSASLWQVCHVVVWQVCHVCHVFVWQMCHMVDVVVWQVCHLLVWQMCPCCYLTGMSCACLADVSCGWCDCMTGVSCAWLTFGSCGCMIVDRRTMCLCDRVSLLNMTRVQGARPWQTLLWFCDDFTCCDISV